MTGDRYYDYIKALKAGSIITTARLEFLDPNGFIDFEISPSDFHIDGQLTVNLQDGVRRTATVTLSNKNHDHDITLYEIWIGQMVRLHAGIVLPDGEEYLLPQGVFYVTNPEETLQPTNGSVTLNLMDKWAGLDGTVGGTLDGIYLINPGDDMYVAIQELLKKDRGNGAPLDSTPPVLDRSLLLETSTVYDADGIGTEVPFTQAPYTLRTEADATYADVLLGINTMLVTSMGYDAAGQLRVMSANTEIKDCDRPIAWEFSLNEREFYGGSFTYNTNDLCNDVRIIGAVSNGMQVQGRATNTNPRSPCNVQTIGYNTHTETQSKYYSFEQCNDLAKYYLRKKTMLQRQISFTSTPIYHLQENNLITLLRPDVSGLPELYLVTGFNLPIGGVNAMTINAVSVEELDIFDKWLTNHTLTIYCSEHDELTVYYDGIAKQTVVENPFDLVQIPAGATVTFSVTSEKPDLEDATNEDGEVIESIVYNIANARLNGGYLPHGAKSCSFTMPAYDAKIVISLTAVAGDEFTYSYTGAHESTDVEIDGISYKLIKLSSSGKITLDKEQIDKGIVCDVWARGAGAGGNAQAKGGNGYEASEYGLPLTDEVIEVEIGTGGATTATKGRIGGTTYFGDSVAAPGGTGANGSAEGTGGTLKNLFGSIEEKTVGIGGDKNAAGTDGAVWLRIIN